MPVLSKNFFISRWRSSCTSDSSRNATSRSGESAAVHFVQSDLTSFSDGISESDNDPAVVRTVETLSVAGSDAPAIKQEKEARTSGGIPSQ
ncbi:MAG: hypothetical protein ACTSXE_05255 [Candidatus Thorarchaeota archaeon]